MPVNGIFNMNFFKSAILGAVQGFTEFLPVSSSGHLAVVGSLFGKISSGLTFEVLLHVATLLAVLYVYRDRIKQLNLRFLALLVVASIPAGLVGVFLGDFVEQAFSSTLLVGFAFLFTGMVLFLVGKLPQGEKKEVGYKEAILIGLAQAVAVLPGISRSGMTIATGLALGLKREEAAAFSFMMSVPVVAGAGLLELKDLLKFNGALTISMPSLLIGFIAAVITGILAIRLVQILLKTDNFNYFSYYLFFVGTLTIIVSLI